MPANTIILPTSETTTTKKSALIESQFIVKKLRFITSHMCLKTNDVRKLLLDRYSICVLDPYPEKKITLEVF